MADEPHRLLSRWARLPLRTHVLAAGAVALAAAVVALRVRPVPAPFAPHPPGPTDNPAFPVRLPPEQLTENEANREAAPIATGYRREIVRPDPVRNADPGNAGAPDDPTAPAFPAAGLASGSPLNRRRDDRKTLPELFRMPPESGSRSGPPESGAPPVPAPGPPRTPAARTAGAAFAPFGRLIGCVLVNTLDSATARAEPIVALVTRDLSWNGAVIVPAGTEAFSYARPEPILDAGGVGRLIDAGEWTLVFPARSGPANGRELILKARAVDRREQTIADDGTVRSWGIDDGADGLVGYAISTVEDREIRLFAAAAVAGLAQGFAAVAQRQQAAPGLAGTLGAAQAAPTLGNAAIGSASQGAVDVANELAGRIRQEIARRGAYIRVPAGKEFYLFVEQTIDPGAAAVGLRLPAGASRTP